MNLFFFKNDAEKKTISSELLLIQKSLRFDLMTHLMLHVMLMEIRRCHHIQQQC